MSTEESLQAILSSIEGTVIDDMQTREQVSNYLIRLTGWMAYTNEQMAVTNRAHNIAKRDAYAKLQEQYNATGVTLSPSLAKDYIGSLCSKTAYGYQMAERTSRTIVHTIDAMRSVLSTMKAEMEALRYAGS